MTANIVLQGNEGGKQEERKINEPDSASGNQKEATEFSERWQMEVPNAPSRYALYISPGGKNGAN